MLETNSFEHPRCASLNEDERGNIKLHMAYQDIHTNHLNDIIELIKANKIKGENEALDKFNAYIDTIQTIGHFDISNWRQDWRQKVWRLGEEFKTLNPQQFLLSIDNKLSHVTTTNKEVLEFIRSEIAFNFLSDNECKKQLEKLIETYPLNSEFRHTYGHFYIREGEPLKGIAEYKLALKIEPKNNTYLKSRFNNEFFYLNKLIKDGEYIKGQKYVESVFAEKFFTNIDTNFHNSFVDFQARFQDHIIFQDRVKKIESDFKEKMHSELDNERKRIIEVLGFFSAIVAFILSTVSLGKNFSFVEAVYFIIALGLILILFAVTLSLLFNSTSHSILKDKKFWILMVSLIVLLLFITKTNNIAAIIKWFEN